MLRPRNHLPFWSAQPREPAPIPVAQGPGCWPAGSVRVIGGFAQVVRREHSKGAASGRGQALVPLKLRTGQSSACLQELEPSETTWPMSPQVERCCQANVKSLPVAPLLRLHSAGSDRLRSLGFGDLLLKHSPVSPLCSPCASAAAPSPGQGFLVAPADPGPPPPVPRRARGNNYCSDCQLTHLRN